MSEKPEKNWSDIARSHRSIYRFGGVWRQAMLVWAPWFDALVIIVLLLVVHARMVVSPGVMFDLPQAPLREGMHAGLTALMIVVSRVPGGADDTLLFFDEDRYIMRDQEQMRMLAERLRARVALAARQELLLLADRMAPHGDVVAFVNLAREAGIQRVNVAQRPE